MFLFCNKIKRFVLLYPVVLSTFCIAQKQGNNWFFGEKIGITFNYGKPVVLSKSEMDAYGGSACISTINGRLLYYTNGDNLYDSNHTSPMILLGGAKGSLQNSLFVPRPDSTNRIYVFSTKGTGNYLIYSEIDTRLNSGRGDFVTGKYSVNLVNNVSGKLTAVKHANRRDYWVVIQTKSDSIFAFLVNSTGVSNSPIISNVGYKDNCSAGERILKLSPDGRKLCSIYCSDSSFIADFNSTNGTVSNIRRFVADGLAVEFSPKSRYLYTLGRNRLSQYDLLTKYQSSFIKSRKTVDTIYNNATGMLQLGVDGKIYFPVFGDDYLHVILFPDNFGDGCIPQRNYVNLNKKNYSLGLPDMIQSLFYKKSFGVAQICSRDTTYFNITNNYYLDSAFWDFGDTASGTLNFTRNITNVYHSYKNPGNYTAKLIAYYKGFIDTIYESFNINYAKPFLGEDATICNSKKIILNPKGLFKSYKWNDGSSFKTLTVTKAGNYSLTVSDFDGCLSSDTVNINSVNINSNFSLSDTNQCLKFNNINLSETTKYKGDVRGQSSWTFGDGTTLMDTIASKHYFQTGIYKIKLINKSKLGCLDSISKTVTIWPNPITSFLINDSIQCLIGNSFDFTNHSSIQLGTLNSVWNLGDTFFLQKNLINLILNKSGQHIIKLISISDHNCRDTLAKVITVEQSPKANFTVTNTCNKNPIQFTFTGSKPSSPIITSYFWEFAGEGTSSIESPTQMISAGKRKITLKVTSSNGCLDILDREIDIKPQATADFDAIDACEDTFAFFKNKTQITSGTATYKWFFGDGQVSTLANPDHKYDIGGISKTFNVKMTANITNGCSDSITKAVTVNAIPKPGFTYTTSGQTVNFVATETIASNYQWSFGDGGTTNTNKRTQSYTYSKFQSGKYKACLTVSNIAGCSSDSCMDIIITGGISNLNPIGIKLYPNPNSGSFTIEIPNLSTNANIQVFDYLGQLVYEIEAVELKSDVVAQLLEGLYIIKVTNGEMIYTQKILIEK